MSAPRIGWLSVLAALAMAGAAEAQPSRCALPSSVAAVAVQPPPAGEIQRGEPVASYVLALSWSPEACQAHPDDADVGIRCRLNRFGFTVHGLWPNGAGAVHPRFCRPPTPVDPATLRANLCMTPSRWLLQHEWEAHGTCAWTSPRSYFAEARALRAQLRAPDLAPGLMTAGEVRRAFLAHNPGMTHDELEVDVDREDRLEEVRVCYDLAFRWSACRGAGGAPDRASLFVAPEASGR